MSWSPISPDLNLIENVWGIIPNEIYIGGKTYFAKGKLEEAIKKAWNDLEND